ncbi:MAG: chemotaxis protein CheB [Melioribacteraceae bacterium]|nr:chemotaxis protein CheB [Melioribacteraceae bacterium]
MDKIKILLAEDNSNSRFYYRKILANQGYIVDTAVNGVEAFDKLKSEKYDILLTDWLMPVLDGIELTNKVRREFDEQPIIIVLTAINSSEAREKALNAGADEYVAKLVEKSSLFETIENTLKRTNSRNHLPLPIKKPALSPQRSFYCVGIAASTGGPSTVTTLFKDLGKVDNAAFMIVQHGQEWMLRTFAGSLQAYTPMPVLVGNNGLLVEPGKIYIAPGEKHMVLKEDTTHIELIDTPPENFVKPSADPLFRSIAKEFGKKSIGIILTGMGHDGSMGAGYISAAGGKIIVQHPDNAILPSMPRSVIELKLHTDIALIENMHKNLNAVLV